MADINKFGLSRNIPEPVKRIVRKRCGFGCVSCGLWIYQYEHILPEFNNAKKHDPDKICLLCPNHHQKVTNEIISKKQVFEQYKSPKALQRGYANDYLLLNNTFNVVLGRFFFLDSRKVLSVNNSVLISFEQPTKQEPMRLNGKFYDNKGDLLMEILDNEFRGFTTNWDIRQQGNRTTIIDFNNKVRLQMLIEPPDILKIEIVDMQFKGAVFSSNSIKGRILVKAKNGAGIDFPSGQIITQGINITQTGVELDKVLVIGVQEGLKLNEMNYKEFLKTGRIISKKN